MAGILIMGLNGCGKSTLGRALAERIGWDFMDVEDFYFPAGQENPYGVSRTREEAVSLLREATKARPRFVYASVAGPRDDEVEARCALAVVLSTPKEVRLRRVEQRQIARFGERVLEGGDMFEQEAAFRAFVAKRSENEVEARAARLACPVLRLDATRPIEESVALIIAEMKKLNIA